jgi:hypothetical protein
MRLPEDIRDQIRDQLWAVAEEIGWSSLPDGNRARYYETWTKDPAIGGKLGHFMDPRKVRVYIKDSLLKPYERARLSETEHAVMRQLSLSSDEAPIQTYIKPHGRRLADGRVVCWGKSRDWKLIVMAGFERAQLLPNGKAQIVLVETGKTAGESARALIREAARRLGLERVEWID